MSKHMQLTVKVRSHYDGTFATTYPKTAGHLRRVDDALVGGDPALFDLVGKMDKLLYALDGNPAFKAILLKHKPRLVELHVEIQKNIADWALDRADRLLYQMEDLFDDIEWEAAKD